MSAKPSITWARITLDCSDAEALGAFYADLARGASEASKSVVKRRRSSIRVR